MADGVTRLVRNVSAGGVALIAAWSSYSHMVHVALMFGESPQVAYVLPFSVDGMLLVASIVMVDDKRFSNRVRPIARLAFAAGVLASVGANIAAAHPSIGARIVAAWPAIALLLVVEMLARPPAPAAGIQSAIVAGGSAATVPATPGAATAAVAAAEVVPTADAASVAAAEVVIAATATADVAAAELRPSARVSAVSADADLPGRGTQPPPAAARVHHSRPQPTGSTAILGSAASSGADLVSAGAASPHPVPPSQPAVPTATPPAVVPPAAARRRERGHVPAAEPAAAPATFRRQVPPPGRTAANRRRPTADTRELARQLIDAEPDLSRAEVAARLGVSARRLREVLATPA